MGKVPTIKITKSIAIFLLVACSVLILVQIHSAYALSYSFGSSIVAGNSFSSASPQVLVNGSNVFGVWKDTSTAATGRLNFTRSTDSGTTFSSPVNISGNVAVAPGAFTPLVAISGSNVYVVWENATSSADIFLVKSTNAGATFGTPIDISNTVANSLNPQFVVSGNNVYITWQEGSPAEIDFAKSTDSGTTFSSTVNLSNTASVASTVPQIAVSGGRVYIVWQEGATAEIDYVKSTDSGTTFSTPVNLSNTPAVSSTSPQIVTSATNLVVVWKEGASSIDCSNSTDSGTTFNGGTSSSPGSPVNLGSATGATTAAAPRISMSGPNVFVVWQQVTSTFGSKNDVFFTKSTDGGITFNGGTTHTPGTPTDLSSNNGDSLLPVISTSGPNVYVFWQDKTVDASGDIYYNISNDNGTTFNGGSPGSPINLSGSTNIVSATPTVGSLSSTVYVVWQEGGTTTAGQIFFARGLPSSTSVGFDAQQYSHNAATLTVVSSASNLSPTSIDTLLATVKSTADSTGITLTLSETGVNTGIFTGQLHFTSSGSSSGSTLRANPGDTITASFGGQTGTASIFSRTVAFSSAVYTLSSLATVKVTDQNSVTNPAIVESIPVTVSSTTTPSGIPLTLTETGSGTGVFTSGNLIYTTGGALFSIGNTVTVTQTETNGGQLTDNTIDTLPVTVTSTSDQVGITLTLTETKVNTGSFAGNLLLTTGSSSSSSSPNTIKVTNGDIVSVTYLGETANGLIIPNPISGVGALPAKIGDTITASYGSTGTAVINPGAGGGGGGGGLLRPGLVLVILQVVLGGSSPSSPPVFFDKSSIPMDSLPKDIKDSILNPDPTKPIMAIDNPPKDIPLAIDNKGFYLPLHANTISTVTETTEKPIHLKLTMADPYDMTHVSLFTNLRGKTREISDSDTAIIYDKGKPLMILDPHHYFSKVDVTESQNGNKYTFDYTITFAKPMEKSDVYLRSWNELQGSTDQDILDAWQVNRSPNPPIQSNTPPLNSNTVPLANPTQPATITAAPTTTAAPSDVLNAIKEWGGYSPTSISDQDLLSTLGIQGHHIPPWFMKTTKWLVDGKITQDDFINSIKYMHQMNMVK